MAQQINLYSPILLTPRRHFSALAIVQALGLLILGLAALASWSVFSAMRLQADLWATGAANDQEKSRLAAELARRAPLPKDTAALEQQLVQARGGLAERRRLLDALDSRRGGAGHANAELLHLLAQTAPPSLWLTEVRRADGRIELAGIALQPEALRPWLLRLAEHPLLAGQPLRAVKVERSDDPAAGAQAWSFRVVSGRAMGDPS